MPDVPAGSEPDAIKPGEVGYLAQLWKGELDRAHDAFEGWEKDAKKVEDRYALEGDRQRAGTKINMLWSNVETLAPALYAKPPKSVAQRRFLDKDPIGRIACRIIQRAVQYQIDGGELHEAMKAVVLDRLLAGRGQAWCRYEPTIEGDEDGRDDAERDSAAPSDGDRGEDHRFAEPASGGDADDDGDRLGGSGGSDLEPPRITAEIVHIDYVHWRDFRHDPARTWSEVRWVARRSYMSKGDLTKRFGAAVADLVPLICGPDGDKDGKVGADERFRKAEVWEVWDRDSRDVIWVASGCDRHLDKREDPYGLEDFFPCPKPLYATVTNGSLVPVSDYEQYRTQAEQLDDIADREDNITSAMRVRGAYDADFPDLARIMKAAEVSMVPVDDMMAKFSQAGGQGLAGAMQFLPLDVFAKGLEALAKRKAEVKADAFETTGLSDILRGQGDPDETASGVQTKGHFATLRLKARQQDVARFARDLVRIMAEMTCELFQPETLAEMSSAYEMDELQVPMPMPPMMGGPVSPGMPGAGPGLGAPPSTPPGPAGGPVPLAPQRLPMMAGAGAGVAPGVGP